MTALRRQIHRGAGFVASAVRLDRRVAELATNQHGVVARSQLIDLGFTDASVDGGIACGRLVRLHHGVFAVGHSALSMRGHWMAAVLASGEGAVISHRSAAAHWGLMPAIDRIDVSRGQGGIRQRRSFNLHRRRQFGDRDRSMKDRIPVTSVPRTLMDLASVASRRQLESAISEAERLGILRIDDLHALMFGATGHKGLGTLRQLIDILSSESDETRSELEYAFLSLCSSRNLPRPLVNVQVAGFEVDCLWGKEKLIVEVDGFRFHSSRFAFNRDRLRDAALQKSGYRVVRLTHQMIHGDPEGTVASIQALLSSVP